MYIKPYLYQYIQPDLGCTSNGRHPSLFLVQTYSLHSISAIDRAQVVPSEEHHWSKSHPLPKATALHKMPRTLPSHSIDIGSWQRPNRRQYSLGLAPEADILE
jgi:hypothetical protein